MAYTRARRPAAGAGIGAAGNKAGRSWQGGREGGVDHLIAAPADAT